MLRISWHVNLRQVKFFLIFISLIIIFISDDNVKWQASHAAVARSIPAEDALIILCTRSPGGTAHEGGGFYQSIGSTVSDAIVRSWLWLTATRSSPLAASVHYCK